MDISRVVVLVGVLLLVGAAARDANAGKPHDAALREVCNKLTVLTLRPDEFSFAQSAEWDIEATPNCCEWPGVHCGPKLLGGIDSLYNITQLFLTGVSGDGSALHIPVAIQALHLQVEKSFVAMPVIDPAHCAVRPGSEHCSHLDTLTITGPRAGDMPLVELPDLSSLLVMSTTLSRLNLTNVDLRRLEPATPSPGAEQVYQVVSLFDVHSNTRDVTLGRRDAHLVNVAGMRTLQTTGDSAPGVTVVERCDDLFEIDVEWAFARPTGMGRLTVVNCKQLAKPPRHVYGHGDVHMRDLPQIAFLPEFGHGVGSIHLEQLPTHVFAHGASRFAALHDGLHDLAIVRCGLTKMFAVPTSIALLDLSNNNLTALDHLAHNHSVPLHLICNGNPMAHVPDVPSLADFRCDDCRFAGHVDVAAHQLAWISLARNRISQLHLAGTEESIDVSENGLEVITFDTGALPAKLRSYYAAHNQLRSVVGEEPQLGPLPSTLERLDISHNHLQVGVTQFPLPESLVELNVAYNNLTRAPPIISSFESSEYFGGLLGNVHVQHYNISGNRIAALDLAGVHSGSFYQSELVTVDVSHNALSQWEEVQRMVLSATKLELLDVRGNRLHAAFTDKAPMFRRALPRLYELHLGDNAFSGPLRVHNAPAVQELTVARAGFRMSTDGPCAVSPLDHEHECLGDVSVGEMVDVADNKRCPRMAVQLPSGHMVSSSDVGAAYHNEVLCQCRFGFYQRGGACVRAPRDAICPGGSNSRLVLPVRGYWRGDAECVNAENVDAGVTACSREFAAYCAPNTTLSTVLASTDLAHDLPRCVAGREARMCSACSAGHYGVGMSRCRACPRPAAAEAGAGVAIVVLLAALLSAAYLLPRESDAMFKVCVIAVQMVAVVGRVSVSLAPFLVSFVQVWAVTLLDVPMLNGCVAAYSAFHDLEGSLIVLAMALGVPLAVYAVGGAYFVTQRVDSEAKRKWADRNVRAACILLWVAFQNFVVVLPAYFQCERDTCTAHSYFARMPFQSCTGSGAAMRNTAITMFTLVIVPLHVAALAWAVRTARAGGAGKLRGLDFFVNGYHDTTNWWDAVLMCGRLLVGMAAALVIGDRLFSAFFVFVVLYTLYELHTNWQPFESPAANWAISWVLFLHSIIFAACMASNTTLLAADVAYDSFILIAQTATMALPIAFVVTVGGRDNRLQQMVRKRMRGANVEKL